MSNNITEAICSYYDKLLCNSNNKTSVTWKIVQTETGRTNMNEVITTISVNGNLINNSQLISDSLNYHILSIAGKIKKIVTAYRMLIEIFLLSHIYQMHSKKLLQQIKFNFTSRHEIEQVIKFLKVF
jgi:hypothetical protein